MWGVVSVWGECVEVSVYVCVCVCVCVCVFAKLRGCREWRLLEGESGWIVLR